PRPELDRGGAGDLQQRLQGAEAGSDDRLDSRANDDRGHDGTGDDGGYHRTRPDPDRHGDESDSDRHHEERRQGRQGRPQEGHSARGGRIAPVAKGNRVEPKRRRRVRQGPPPASVSAESPFKVTQEKAKPSPSRGFYEA